MTLNDAVQAALPELRTEALSRMLSTATVRRKTGAKVWDEDEGANVPEWVDVHLYLPFRLGGSPRGASQSRGSSVAGVDVELALRTGHMPHGTTDLQDGDLIDVTDGESAGTVWQIVEADLAEQQTAVRVPIVGVKRPTEWGA